MTMTRRTVLAAAAMAAGLGLAQAQEPIKIGAINPYSGPLAQYGDEATRGFELGVEAINAAGGIGGRKLVIVRGDAGNPQQGIAAVEKLVSQDKVDLFMGTYISAVANAASDAAARHGKI
jgi:branched-chain amino acid transport system substrate-binding protein